jgi:L-iditol 2-dehydrogenase
MKAAIFHGKNNIQIEDVVPLPLNPGEVRIQIAVALTCGTDLKVLKRGYHAKMLTPPSPFGHELAGTISEIARPAGNGHAASNWKVGDRVVVANSAPCGNCFFCKNHQENLCEDLLFLNGAYAETIVVPARFVQKNMLRLKPKTNFEDAALAEPLACVVQGIEDLDLQKGQSVLVLGTGPIGLMFIALAKHLGCTVSAVGRGQNRLRAAQQLGAEHIFDAGKDGDIVKAISQTETKTNGHASHPPKFDVVIEAIGKPETWEAAVRLVRKGGAVNFFGGCPGGTTVSLDTHTIHYSNLKLLASFHHTPKTFRRAILWMDNGRSPNCRSSSSKWPRVTAPSRRSLTCARSPEATYFCMKPSTVFCNFFKSGRLIYIMCPASNCS